MGTKAFKTIFITYQDSQKDKNQLVDFLNNQQTGEIHDIKAFYNAGNHDLFYAIIYEKLSDDELSEDTKKFKKDIKEIKQSKSKPKLL